MEDKRITKVEETKKFLRKWTSRDGSRATYTKLYEVLIKLHQQGAAEEIYHIGHKRSDTIHCWLSMNNIYTVSYKHELTCM